MEHHLDTMGDKLWAALEPLCVDNGNTTMAAFLIDGILDEDAGEEALKYIASHPGISLRALWDAAVFYWFPPIIVSDDPIDSEALMAYKERIFQKLSRHLKCEEDTIRAYHEIVHPSLQLLFTEELEEYVDCHPQASYEDIKLYCKSLQKQKNDEIASQCLGNDTSDGQ